MSEKNPENKKIRQPIVTILGHIDHGKTSLLDYVRGTLVQKREAAGITQHIGASFFPIQNILDFCGPTYAKMKISIPGLLVVDTPGHAAFMNLRRRGGAVADIAILVIDVTAGSMPITWESVRILKERKVPFIIAANKIDVLHGWKSIEKADFMQTFKSQPDYVQQDLDQRLYQIVGDFFEEGFAGCERYDRIQDFTKNIAIVPTSAKTGEGIPTLLMVLIGLVQQYLQKRIRFSEGAAKGVVLEVKQDSHLGTSLDCLIYDGILKKNQQIVIGGIPHAVKTKVRAIMTPNPLDEIRDPENKFLQINEVYAAAGIKMLAPNIENVVAGAPLRSVLEGEDIDEIYQEIEEELGEIQIETEDEGVILKADTLGSLEAIVTLFKENDVKIRTAKVGSISKRDIMEAVAVREEDPYNAVVLGFNVEILKDAADASNDQGIRIFTNDVIYRKEFKDLIPPGKFQIIPDFVFRKSDPAVAGVKVLAGKLTPKTRLVNQEGQFVGRLHQIQENNQTIKEATKDMEVAVSMKNTTIGRNLKVEDTIYIYVPESHVRTYNGRFRDELSEEQIALMREYIKVMRKKYSPYWGL
jgi:translation initiation factor 5B